MSTLLQAGKLISTTDMKLAAKLHQVVDIKDITGGAQPRALQQTGGNVSFIFNDEFYELAAA